MISVGSPVPGVPMSKGNVNTLVHLGLEFDLLFSDGQKIPLQNGMHQLNVNKITIRLKSKILLPFSENCCENLHTYCLTYHRYTNHDQVF